MQYCVKLTLFLFGFQNVVIQLVETQMTTNMNAQGIIMDGFPRDMEQVKDFEEKVVYLYSTNTHELLAPLLRNNTVH